MNLTLTPKVVISVIILTETFRTLFGAILKNNRDFIDRICIVACIAIILRCTFYLIENEILGVTVAITAIIALVIEIKNNVKTEILIKKSNIIRINNKELTNERRKKIIKFLRIRLFLSVIILAVLIIYLSKWFLRKRTLVPFFYWKN